MYISSRSRSLIVGERPKISLSSSVKRVMLGRLKDGFELFPSFFVELLEFSEDRHPWESVEEKLNAIRFELLASIIPPFICPSFPPLLLPLHLSLRVSSLRFHFPLSSCFLRPCLAPPFVTLSPPHYPVFFLPRAIFLSLTAPFCPSIPLRPCLLLPSQPHSLYPFLTQQTHQCFFLAQCVSH